MLKVATWTARGMHAGIVVPCRRVANNQHWTVIVKIRKPSDDGADQVDQLQFRSQQACPLRAMHALVMREVSDVLTDGEKVRDASIDFYIAPRA